MSYQIIKKSDCSNRVKLSGKLTTHDFQELQALARSSLEQFGQVRILFELKDFQGWSNETGWENRSFLEENGKGISKIAFVGDEKWKVEIFMFTGGTMRQAAIEFFPQGQLDRAQAWLSGESQ
ncbi:MAG: STAS/SEC14 domain-containing protein [Methylococcales bacterium]|nr:STAS/SEC14 domain-containing protein [Methylococcales bacterium]